MFPGTKISDKICVTELNKNLLKSTSNIWSKQTYLQEFYCESIAFEASVNMFECLEIAESIYEGVVETYY